MYLLKIDQEGALLGICSMEQKHKQIGININKYFVEAKSNKQFHCPSVNGWISCGTIISMANY